MKPMHVDNTLVTIETLRWQEKRQLAAHQLRQNALNKIERFCQTAIDPQTVTLTRDPAATDAGIRVFRVLKGRVLDGIPEQGVRVVILENSGIGEIAKSRFIMSSLFPSEHDALTWARQQGAI